MKIKKEYHLYCPHCASKYNDDGSRIRCSKCEGEGRQTILEFYPEYKPEIDEHSGGIGRYDDFLPGKTPIEDTVPMVNTVRSEHFASKYGFNKLFFTYTGYEKTLNISSPTCSFKDFEAITVIHRLKSFGVSKPILLSSAGNTARAFSYFGAKNQHPTIIVVPANSRNYLWLPEEKGLFDNVRKYIKVFFIKQPGNFLDASNLTKLITSRLHEGLLPEGGYFNIGRTSGLGVCALNFFDVTGQMPDHYVQAVGSASGALSALRAYALLNKELAVKVNFHLVQNYPYNPLTFAIDRHAAFTAADFMKHMDTACAPMLTSANPAYDCSGGIRGLIDKEGMSFYGYSVTNEEIYQTHHEFMKLENIDLLLPAAAALAGLLKAKNNGIIKDDELVQVNITGCGALARRIENGYFYVPSADNAIDLEVCRDQAAFEKWFNYAEEHLLDFQ